jgi:type III pantothenate kinase
MLLAIDIGNTNTVLGLFEGDQIASSFRVNTDGRATADEIALQWRGLLDDAPVDGIVLERRYADVPSLIVEPGVKTGVPLLYDNPREVGADRIVNSLAAFTLYGGPAIVVDFGTSTNFDIISTKGEFLGGALAPGIEISVDALASRAARLLKVEIARPRSVIGKSTVEALQSGLLYGFAGQVDGLVRRIEAESETIQHENPWLTLIGLRLVFERNKAS